MWRLKLQLPAISTRAIAGLNRTEGKRANERALPTLIALVLFSATATAQLDRFGSLPGFDPEARDYIRSQANLRQTTPDFADWADRGGGKQNRVFQWLMPFCSDLRSYEGDYSREENPGWVRFRFAYVAINLIRAEWLPATWTKESVQLQNPWPAEHFRGKVYSFFAVPNFIVPVFSSPNRAPVMLKAWQYQSREGVKFSVLSSWKFHAVVVHREGGFGVAAASKENLTGIRDRYFQFPPGDLVLPEGWGADFDVARADGRFVSGRMWSLRKGIRPIIPSRNTWEWAAEFFYDGTNLAFVVTHWNRGRAETFPALGDPLDIDWTLPQYQR